MSQLFAWKNVFWQKINMIKRLTSIPVLSWNAGYVQRKKGIPPVFSFAMNVQINMSFVLAEKSYSAQVQKLSYTYSSMNVAFTDKLIYWHEIYYIFSITNLSKERMQSTCFSTSCVFLGLNMELFSFRYHLASFTVT